MGNQSSNKWRTINDRGGTLLSAAGAGSQTGKELEFERQQCEIKPRHGGKTRHQHEKFFDYYECEKKGQKVKLQGRNQCMSNLLAAYMHLPEEIDRSGASDILAGNLSNPRAQLNGDNCKYKSAGPRNENDCVIVHNETTGMDKCKLESETKGSLNKFEKCLNVNTTSKIKRKKIKKKMRKRRMPVGGHEPSATMNVASSSTTRNVASSSTTTNNTPLATSRRRFCILNKSDKNSLRSQISIWFPYVCHKPTMKVLQDSFVRMKCSVLRELRKLEIIDFNKHITHSKEQRNLFRKEHLHERSPKCKPIYYTSSIVPECLKGGRSLNFDSNGFPLMPGNDTEEKYDKEQKPINYKTKATKNLEGNPFTANERRWGHSLIYLDCDKLQMATQSEVSANVNELEMVKPFAEEETKRFNIPEWFQTMLKKEVTININPARPSERKGHSSEIKELMSCQRRLQLGRMFPSSDFSSGDGCFLMSVKEQEVKSLGDIDERLPTKIQTTSLRPNVQQREIKFERDSHENLHRLEKSMPLDYSCRNYASKCLQSSNGSSAKSIRRRLRRRNRVPKISNHKSHIYKKLSMNTESIQEHSHSRSAEDTHLKLGNCVISERSDDKKQNQKGVYQHQLSLFHEKTSNTILSDSDLIYQEINGESVSKTATNIISETKLADRITTEGLQNRTNLPLEKIIPEVNSAVRQKSKIPFKGKQENNAGTDPTKNTQKENVSGSYNKPVFVYQNRSKSCGLGKCGQLSRNIRKDRSWARELRNVPTSGVTNEEADIVTFEKAAASNVVITNTLLDNYKIYFEQNVGVKMYPKINKTMGGKMVTRNKTTTMGKMNRSNSSVHGVQGVFDSSQAIVVDDVMDSQQLCMNSNDESVDADLTLCDPHTETSVGTDVTLAYTVIEPPNYCIATDTESKLNQLILVQSGEDADFSFPTNAINIDNRIDLQATGVSCGTETNLEQTRGINLDKDIQSKVVKEITSIDGVIQSLELGVGINTESKLNQITLIEPRENIKLNTMTEVNETQQYVEQLQVEKYARTHCLNSYNEDCLSKSPFLNCRQTSETYLNNSAKMSESEIPLSPIHDISCLENKRSENEFTATLLNFPGHKFQCKKTTSAHEKTNHYNENNESTVAASSNACRMSSRESLVDFIKEQWRSCVTSVIDATINENQANLLNINSHFSSNDVSQRTSPAFCPDRKPLFCDVEGKTRGKSNTVQEEQSYESMCSDRRENYLKICRALENYYKSGCHEYFNNISSITTKNPQANERDLANSLRQTKMSASTLLSVNKILSETQIKSEMLSTKSTPSTVNFWRSLQSDYKTMHSCLQYNRQSRNADIKQTISPRTCNVTVNKLLEERMVSEVMSDPQGYGTVGVPQAQANQSPSSLCADTTNQNVLSNRSESESSSLNKPNYKRKWLMNKIKTSHSLPTNKPCEDDCILTALDKLLERYFRSIEELQERLEKCNIKASKYDKHRKSKQKRDNKLLNTKSKRQKKPMLSESELYLYQNLSYERFNSQIMVEDAYSKQLKDRKFVKPMAWNCSVNNKQDSLSDSIPSDVDLIGPTPNSYMNKKHNGSTESVSVKERQADAAVYQDTNVSEPKLLNEDGLASPDDKISESPFANDVASPEKKASTSRRSSEKSKKQQRGQMKPPKLQGFEATTPDSEALPRFTSRIWVPPEYPEVHQADSTSSRYKKRAPVSDQATKNYSTRDVGTSILENQLLGMQRKVYSPTYDKDSNNRQIIFNDSSIRRRRTTEKQEHYDLTTREQEYITQPINSYRHLSSDYVDSEWTPVSSKISDLRSNGKSDVNTEQTRKYCSTKTESGGAYYTGGVTPREHQERREFAEKAKYVPTFNSQTRIPDYCLNQTRGLSRATDRPTTPPRGATKLNVCQKLEQRNKKQDEPCQLSPAQNWFRDLCERVNTRSAVNGAVTPQSRYTHANNKYDRNLRFEARICVTPTVCCTPDDAKRNIRKTLGARDVHISRSKEYCSNFRSLKLDNREPSKNYNDIALFEKPAKYDSNIRGRPEGFRDYIYSQVTPVEATVQNKDPLFSHAALEKLQPVHQTEQYKLNTGTQYEINHLFANRVENPGQETTRSNMNNTKVCVHVCTQTCACISKPNGTCLCGYISLNEMTLPHKANMNLAPNPERQTEGKLNFKTVFIQTYDDVEEEKRMEKLAFKKDEEIVKEKRFRQYSPNQIKCRNKKCQIGHSVQYKNESTGVGPSLSDGLPCNTLSTHCHRHDTKQNTITSMTKCVQTTSFSDTRNIKRPFREEKIICCKCKQKLDKVMAKQFETLELSSELATDSYENDNDKGCTCDSIPEYTMPKLEHATGQENSLSYIKYQTKPPCMQKCTCKNGQKLNVEDRLVSEDDSDVEWVHETTQKEQPTSRYGPSQVERLPHQPPDNACTITNELTEQISGIIRNSRLLQQQAVLLRDKCKYLEGQGWTSINQNRHEALNASRSKKFSNMLRCYDFKTNSDEAMDKNNNADSEFHHKLDQENKIKCFNKLSSHVCFVSNQCTPYKNDYVTDTAGSYYRKFIRQHLGHKGKFQQKENFQRKQENKNRNWNAKPRMSSKDVSIDRSNQKRLYKHPENERWFINDPSEEAYQYMRAHFPDICRNAPIKKDSILADSQVPCNSCMDDSQNKEYTKRKQLCKQHSGLRQASSVTIATSRSCICLKEQNLCKTMFNGSSNLSMQLSKHDEGRTKSHINAKSGKKTTEVSHNRETVNAIVQEPCLQQDIYSACCDVSSACHNEFGQSVRLENNSVHAGPVNVPRSSSALKKNYWQLAYKIGSISGNQHPGSHAWNHQLGQLNMQRQEKTSDEDGVCLARPAPPAETKDRTRLQLVTEGNSETHSVPTIVSSTNLKKPFQEHISLLDDKKLTSYFPMVDSGSSCYEDKYDASVSYVSSPQIISPDSNIPVYVDCSSRPTVSDSQTESVKVMKKSHNTVSDSQTESVKVMKKSHNTVSDSQTESVKVMKKSHNLCQNCGDISDICDLPKHRLDILNFEEKAGQSPGVTCSCASLKSVKIVPNERSGVHVLKEIFLDVISADIGDTQRNKSPCEGEQHVFTSDRSQILASGASQQQCGHQLPLREKCEHSVPQNITNFECESSSMADYVPLQKGQCLPKSEMKSPCKLRHRMNVLDSQDSNHGIKDTPLNITFSEHEITGSDPMKLKEHKPPNALLCKNSKFGKKDTVLIKRPLSLIKQDKQYSYLNNSRMKLTSPECKGSLLPEWKSVIDVENAFQPTHETVELQAPSNFHRHQVRAETPRQVTQGRVVKPSEVSVPLSDIENRLHVEEESNNEQVVGWWNSPKFFQKRRIRKDKAKYTTHAFRSRLPTFLDRHNPSIISKSFGYISDSSTIRKSRCIDVHERDSVAVASNLEYPRDNKSLQEMPIKGKDTLRNNHRSKHFSADKTNDEVTSNKWCDETNDEVTSNKWCDKTNDEVTSNKWCTCFLGCAQVIEANDQMVSIEGSYVRQLSSLQKHKDFKTCKVHPKKVECDRSQCMDTDPKVVQFRLVLCRNKGSGDSAELSGKYSRQLLTSGGYFNWELLF